MLYMNLDLWLKDPAVYDYIETQINSKTKNVIYEWIILGINQSLKS